MEDSIPDERLKLMFTCCHPALALEAQVALTLHTLGGLSTPEVARAFLVPVPTMAQRLARARRKIRDAGIPLPRAARRSAARAAGRAAGGDLPDFQRRLCCHRRRARSSRGELCAEAIRLGRVLAELLPGSAEARGLLAADAAARLAPRGAARRGGRAGAAGRSGPLALGPGENAEGTAVLDEALALHDPGPYQVQAAISALHAEAADPEDDRLAARSPRCMARWRG